MVARRKGRKTEERRKFGMWLRRVNLSSASCPSKFECPSHRLFLNSSLPDGYPHSMSLSEDPRRPSKKRKSSFSNDASAASSSQQQSAPVEKSSAFWVEDGNIILRTSTKLYRVHRGILSMHSTVFRDMFSLPQPQEQQPTFEGVPVVDLTDSAKDWDLLLPVIYGVECAQAPGATHIAPPLLIAMLRLGRKYDFDRFKRPALKQLKSYFPDSLDHLDDFPAGHQLSRAMFPHIFELTQIALDLNIQRALPTALFRCVCDRGMKSILSGRDSPEGPVYLSPKLQEKLVLGKEALILESAKGAMGWFFELTLNPSCLAVKTCSAEKRAIMAAMGQMLMPRFALTSIDTWLNLCKSCHSQASQKNASGREKTFQNLPSFFGLEPWDKLVDDF